MTAADLSLFALNFGLSLRTQREFDYCGAAIVLVVNVVLLLNSLCCLAIFIWKMPSAFLNHLVAPTVGA
jgi:hypothetical protein